MVIHTKEDGTYSLLENANSSILISEERINLFRASYGIYQSEIDFSTYKFRLQAQPSPDRILICRVVQQLKVFRIKSSILQRADFDEYLMHHAIDLHDKSTMNYATISLYGKLKYQDQLGTIQSEEISDIREIDHSNFTKVYLEIDLQTSTESVNLQDSSTSFVFLLVRNQHSLDDLARDLKNTTKNYKILQEHRTKYTLTNKELDFFPEDRLVINESQSDNDSWSGSVESQDKNVIQLAPQKAAPDAFLKTGFPEIKTSILEQNDKVNMFYIINKKIYD